MSQVFSYLKTFDKFNHPVNLTYGAWNQRKDNDSNNHKTFLGFIFTFLKYIIMSIIVGYYGLMMLTNDNNAITQNIITPDWEQLAQEQNTTIDKAKLKINLAELPSLPIFRFFTTGTKYLNYDDDLKKYINVSIFLETRDEFEQTKNFKEAKYYKKLRKCIDSDFKAVQWPDYLQGQDQSQYYEHCIENFDGVVTGVSSQRLGQDLLAFQITKCNPKNNQNITCETDDQKIKSKLDPMAIKIWYITLEADFTSNNPATRKKDGAIEKFFKPVIQNIGDFYFSTLTYKATNIYLQKNIYQRNDYWYNPIEQSETNFVTIQSLLVKDIPKLNSNTLYQMYILPNPLQNLQTRKAYSIIEFLGNIGGISEIIHFVVQLFLHPLTYHNFILNAISSFFIIKYSTENKIFQNETENQYKDKKSQFRVLKRSKKNSQDESEPNSKEKTHQRIEFSFKDSFYLFCSSKFLIYFRKLKYCKKKSDQKSRYDFLDEIYRQGEERFVKELQLERLLIQMRELKAFMKNSQLLNRDIRYDLQFEKQMVIDLDLFQEKDQVKSKAQLVTNLQKQLTNSLKKLVQLNNEPVQNNIKDSYLQQQTQNQQSEQIQTIQYSSNITITTNQQFDKDLFRSRINSDDNLYNQVIQSKKIEEIEIKNQKIPQNKHQTSTLNILDPYEKLVALPKQSGEQQLELKKFKLKKTKFEKTERDNSGVDDFQLD